MNRGAEAGLNRESSHLDAVSEWISLARTARYDAAELAGLCKGSQRQLQRFFHERFGRTPRQCLNEMRLRDAPDLLLTTKHVKPAAYELGFRHPSHFIRKFKRVYGYTPMKFVYLAFAERDQAAQPPLMMGLSMNRSPINPTVTPPSRGAENRLRRESSPLGRG